MEFIKAFFFVGSFDLKKSDFNLNFKDRKFSQDHEFNNEYFLLRRLTQETLRKSQNSPISIIIDN